MLSLVVVAALAASVAAFADDGPPSSAVAACKVEYQQLGPGGFAAKYGAGDVGFRTCVQQHGGTQQPPPSTGGEVVGSIAYALCAVDYKQLGAAGFVAKYGSGDAGRKACLQAKAAQAQTILSQCQASAGSDKEAFARCIKNALGTPTSGGGQTGGEVVGSIAYALCAADYKQLGAAGFVAKYGSGDAGRKACLQAKAAQAQTILSQCQASAGSDKEAFARCIKNALGTPTGDGGDKGSAGQDTVAHVAGALCAGEARASGHDAFTAKYGAGKDGMKTCLQAALPKARAILDSCKGPGGGDRSGDAFKQCVTTAIKNAVGG
jgi:hypothetical protein